MKESATERSVRNLCYRRVEQATSDMRALGIVGATVGSPNGDTIATVHIDDLEALIRLAWKGSAA